jgi:hypothetical protein
MKKLVLVLPLLLAACGDDEANRIKELEAQQYQARIQLEQQQQQFAAQQQQMYAQQQQIAQQNAQPPAQPQYAPQAPVVVQPPQHDNTMMNMAVGALAGHAISNAMNSPNNNRPSERVVEHKTVVIDNRQPIAPSNNFKSNFASSVPSPTKQNYMDMNKLSQSSKYAPPSAPTRPSSSMSMSKLSRR